LRHNIVYRTKNLVTGHEYTGKHETDLLEDGYLGSGKRLQHAIKKYGRENFAREVLHDFETTAEMDAMEAALVTEDYCSREDTYNICPGGRGGWGYINANGLVDAKTAGQRGGLGNRGKKKSNISDLWKASLSIASKRAWSEGKLQISQMNTPEAIAKRSETMQRRGHQKGEKNSQYGTCWITNGIEVKKIPGKNLDIWLKQGFRKGRK
jgi:hypothetical protein